jgi:hypothetical protein
MMVERGKMIRASEIGEYVFCARAWRLRIEGVEASGWGEARERGTAWHREHGRGVRSARNLRRLASVATAFASLLALVIFALWWWRG